MTIQYFSISTDSSRFYFLWNIFHFRLVSFKMRYMHNRLPDDVNCIFVVAEGIALPRRRRTRGWAMNALPALGYSACWATVTPFVTLHCTFTRVGPGPSHFGHSRKLKQRTVQRSMSHHTRRLHVLHLGLGTMRGVAFWLAGYFAPCRIFVARGAEILRVPQSSANCQSRLSKGAEWGSDEWSVRSWPRLPANGVDGSTSAHTVAGSPPPVCAQSVRAAWLASLRQRTLYCIVAMTTCQCQSASPQTAYRLLRAPASSRMRALSHEKWLSGPNKSFKRFGLT